MTKKEFIQNRVVGNEYHFKDDLYDYMVKVVRVDFNEFSHMTEVYVDIEGWISTYDTMMGRWYDENIKANKLEWRVMANTERVLKQKIGRIVQYVNVFEDEIYIML